jgi:hypothetical protein
LFPQLEEKLQASKQALNTAISESHSRRSERLLPARLPVHRGNLSRLFREGKIIGPSTQTVIEIKNQSDLSRLFVNGVFRLIPDLEPGNYFLQDGITDKASRDKQPSSTQWVGFEIVK